MTEILLNWVADRFASSDIIDLYFVLSDLVDIHLTEAERCEAAYFDAKTIHSAEGMNSSQYGNIPLGKLVL
jgi:hypothetical protein